jgi:hypothetical protein
MVTGQAQINDVVPKAFTLLRLRTSESVDRITEPAGQRDKPVCGFTPSSKCYTKCYSCARTSAGVLGGVFIMAGRPHDGDARRFVRHQVFLLLLQGRFSYLK